MRQLFEVIVDPTIRTVEQVDQILDEKRTHGELPDDSLFMNAFIPHKLDHIMHFERDDEAEKQGKELNNPFQKIIGKVLEPSEAKNEGHYCVIKMSNSCNFQISSQKPTEKSDLLAKPLRTRKKMKQKTKKQMKMNLMKNIVMKKMMRKQLPKKLKNYGKFKFTLEIATSLRIRKRSVKSW
jgi:hypothetical protein